MVIYLNLKNKIVSDLMLYYILLTRLTNLILVRRNISKVPIPNKYRASL